MVTMTLPLRRGREPDWEAAARAIRCLRLEVLWGAGDSLYPWEDWLEDAGELPGAEAAFVLLRTAQAELRQHAAGLRGAVEHGWPEELIVFETPAHRVWITGGPSWGEPATDLTYPLIDLAEAGITDAAGFEGYTSYASQPIENRHFEFAAEDLRRVRFGVAAAHAVEQAAAIKHPAPDASPREWLNTWVAELHDADDDETGGRGLLRFAARGLALSVWLKHGNAEIMAAGLVERARALTLLADAGGLAEQPQRRRSNTAARDARTIADELADRFEALADPDHQADEDVRSFVENTGGTLGDAIENEVASRALLEVVAALADLCGDDVGDLIEAPPEPIPSVTPPASTCRYAPLAQYLSLLLVDQLDWSAGEQAVDRLAAEVREECRADLAELRRLLSGEGYWRFATWESIGAHRLFIAASHGGAGTDVAMSIGRLGRDGILEAVGAAGWSLPDPDFEGPVQSYVPGHGPRA